MFHSHSTKIRDINVMGRREKEDDMTSIMIKQRLEALEDTGMEISCKSLPTPPPPPTSPTTLARGRHTITFLSHRNKVQEYLMFYFK